MNHNPVGTFTRDDYDRAKKLGRKLFGDRMNVFFDLRSGYWHFGRFTDNGGPMKSEGRDVVAPHRRPQEVFGVGKTLAEAMAFVDDGRRLYSIPGLAPTPAARGWRVRFDRRGNIHGYESPAGIFSKHFPGEPGQWS